MTQFHVNEDGYLLRAGDVARILNISKPMVYRLIQRGEIPAVRIGTLVRIRQRTLDHYIESQEFANPNPSV